jgi:ABC-type nickel/cobalt efflux system permease component RcnA
MRSRGLVLALILAALAVAGAAHAQSPLGIGSAEPSMPASGLFGPLLVHVNAWQQEFYRSLTGALKAMRQDPGELWKLVGLSFAYGVFHAAGPGHGKAVISSYMVANEVELRRGVFISFASAALQGATAILVAGLAFLVLRGTSISMTDATTALERASFALVVLFGLWLLIRKVKALIPARNSQTALLFAGAGGEPHVHGPDCRHGFGDFAVEGAASQGFACEACGHTHLPAPQSLGSSRFGISEAWSAIVAVGLRPCSGALLVLTFSLLNGLYLGGVLSVLAMALGTAITVSILAVMAVGAKDLALSLAGRTSRAGAIIGHAAEIGAAMVIVLLGLTLLAASFEGGGSGVF